MLTRIHVNQHNVRANIKGASLPVITVKAGKSNTYGNKVEIIDDYGKVVATVLYSPEKPLSCGAKVWVETSQPVLIDGKPLCTAKGLKMTRLSVFDQQKLEAIAQRNTRLSPVLWDASTNDVISFGGNAYLVVDTYPEWLKIQWINYPHERIDDVYYEALKEAGAYFMAERQEFKPTPEETGAESL